MSRKSHVAFQLIIVVMQAVIPLLFPDADDSALAEARTALAGAQATLGFYAHALTPEGHWINKGKK